MYRLQINFPYLANTLSHLEGMRISNTKDNSIHNSSFIYIYIYIYIYVYIYIHIHIYIYIMLAQLCFFGEDNFFLFYNFLLILCDFRIMHYSSVHLHLPSYLPLFLVTSKITHTHKHTHIHTNIHPPTHQ